MEPSNYPIPRVVSFNETGAPAKRDTKVHSGRTQKRGEAKTAVGGWCVMDKTWNSKSVTDRHPLTSNCQPWGLSLRATVKGKTKMSIH